MTREEFMKLREEYQRLCARMDSGIPHEEWKDLATRTRLMEVEIHKYEREAHKRLTERMY